jgi:hypothetical protein
MKLLTFFLSGSTALLKISPCRTEDKLLNSNVSRTFYTQKLLPGAGAAKMEETLEGRLEDKKTAVTAPKDFVRTNAADQKMDRFLVKKTGGESAGDQEKRIPQQVEQELEANRPVCQLTSVKALRLQLQVSIFVFVSVLFRL